jgi:hypothetical protein
MLLCMPNYLQSDVWDLISLPFALASSRFTLGLCVASDELYSTCMTPARPLLLVNRPIITIVDYLCIRTITFSKIAIIFSTHTFSIFARIFSIPCVQDHSGLFPTLLQYRAAWSAHMNMKIKLCSGLTLCSPSRPIYTGHVQR